MSIPKNTDAVTQANTPVNTQTNTKVVGEAPAASIDENTTIAIEQAVTNTVHNSQINDGTLIEQAATTTGINTLYEMDEAAEGHATKEIFKK